MKTIFAGVCNIITLLWMVLVVAGCNHNEPRQSTTTPYELSEDYLNKVIRYTVQQGDRLGDISLEFTGKQQNWRDIARHNGISNPRKLRVGSIVEIPTNLIPGYSVAARTKKPQNRSKPTPTTLALKRANDTKKVPPPPVVLTPVKTRRHFELSPLANSPHTDETGSSSSDHDRFVEVVGSYYPKGVYAQPAAHSKLLLRVTPGTTFRLERVVNDWFKISTEQGLGYIRTSDAKIRQNSDQNLLETANSPD